MRLIPLLVLVAAPLAAQETPVAPATVVPPPVVRTDPEPTPVATPTLEEAQPTPARTRVPRRSVPTPVATAPSPAVPLPVATATLLVPIATPTPVAPPPPMPAGGGRGWLVALMAALVAAGAGGFWLARRRAADAPVDPPEPVIVAPAVEPAPVPLPAGAGFVTSSLRPRIELGFRPVRAGVETLRARVEYELTVANTGSALAAGLHVELVLLSAGNSHDRLLAQFWADPRGAPVTDGLTIEVGGAARVAGEAVMDREAIETITAAERRMFVPLVAVRVLSAAGHVLARGAWLVGVERAGAAKLAPLALDRSGMRGGLAARDYGVK